MTEARTIVARLLFALALIVQIVAPARASVDMVRAATDPLAGVTFCGHDLSASGDQQPGDHSGTDACRLCDLVCHGAGFADAPAAVAITVPAAIAVDVLAPAGAPERIAVRAIRPSLPRGPPTSA